MKSKMKNIVKMHPFSTALSVIYFLAAILQGSLELFLAGFLAAFGAYVLELLFCATGMIRTGRNCDGRPRPSGIQGGQKQRSAA